MGGFKAIESIKGLVQCLEHNKHSVSACQHHPHYQPFQSSCFYLTAFCPSRILELPEESMHHCLLCLWVYQPLLLGQGHSQAQVLTKLLKSRINVGMGSLDSPASYSSCQLPLPLTQVVTQLWLSLPDPRHRGGSDPGSLQEMFFSHLC